MNEAEEKYIVAVSGGVDSVVLLDMLVTGRLEITNNKLQKTNKSQITSSQNNHQSSTTGVLYVVAHFDHGIRDDSGQDAQFVKELANKYGLEFELGEGKLGDGVSESTAREVRYNFLRQCCEKHKAQGIITAHHQDDLVETVVINLIRGSGWRGLTSLTKITNINTQKRNNTQAPNNDIQIIRPLIDTPKQKLIEYAKENNLEWREDSTNLDNKYLRNYVRNTLLPKAQKVDDNFNKKLLELIKAETDLKIEIEAELESITDQMAETSKIITISKHSLIRWPTAVAQEVIYSILTRQDPDWHPLSGQIKRVLHFIKTARRGKILQVSGRLNVATESNEVKFIQQISVVK